MLRTRGVFHEAKARGYRTEVLGWYFPYCEELGTLADSCREFSMYNTATVDDEFSIWRPFLTLANMWPYQWPTGMAKRPAAQWLHAAEFDALNQRLARPSGTGPTLRWTHLNVPHRPWISSAGTAVNAFDPSPEQYEMQLAQVDRTLAPFLERLRAADRFDRQVIVLTSDHGARDGLVSDDPLRVSLVVRTAGQTLRHDTGTRIEVRRVLNELPWTACGKN